MGLKEANMIVKPAWKSNRLAVGSPSARLRGHVSIHSAVDERCLGVDLSSIVHTLFPTPKQVFRVRMCKDPAKVIELAALADADPRFHDMMNEAFDFPRFELLFGTFLNQLQLQRPNLLFIADGPPPPQQKQERAKAQRLQQFEQAIQSLTSLLMRKRLGDDSLHLELNIHQEYAKAMHRWSTHSLHRAVAILRSKGCRVEVADCEAEQLLVRSQRDRVVHDIMCNDGDYFVLGGTCIFRTKVRNLDGFFSYMENIEDFIQHSRIPQASSV
eukprot:m.350836 g.350836  ORF g.350836 m.350836 type:complete len:271 (+) comp16160_c0_seq7:2059-2871(+)